MPQTLSLASLLTSLYDIYRGGDHFSHLLKLWAQLFAILMGWVSAELGERDHGGGITLRELCRLGMR